MRADYLKLIAFRNYAALELRPNERLTMLVGGNAEGKTSVIEAIFMLACGRSHRTVKDGELVNWGSAGAYSRLDFTRGGRARRVELKIYKNGKKQGKADGLPLTRMGDLIGCFNAVMFSPEDLRLVKDGPGERRRFMDMELSQIRPQYFFAISKYARALSMRNALLKEMAAGKKGDELDEFDAMLCSLGSEIISMRREFVTTIGELAEHTHARITDGEKLGVIYRPDVLEDRLPEIIAAGRAEDIKRGATQRGPHKDDILLTIGGNDVRSYGSQGQQRTAALSLKLSELELVRQEAGEWPLLLLDDVMSELDETRQKRLVQAIGNCQTMLTCTQLDKRLARYGEVYRVQSGSAERV